MEKEIRIYYQEYNSEEHLSEEYKKLVEVAKQATKSAYAPYSKFQVGVALLLDNKEIISGNNQENAAYPSGLCAERVATFYANAQFPNNAVLAIAIVAQNADGFLPIPITPCGSCRQVLLETEERYNHPITVILYGTEQIYKIPSVKSLLPFSFDKKVL
ncbi:MAG: cytidine deaminase [Flavobacteriaceae bacterium]|nr:cytidine deaminase [Flavobacteriaceae bacterium]